MVLCIWVIFSLVFYEKRNVQPTAAVHADFPCPKRRITETLSPSSLDTFVEKRVRLFQPSATATYFASICNFFFRPESTMTTTFIFFTSLFQFILRSRLLTDSSTKKSFVIILSRDQIDIVLIRDQSGINLSRNRSGIVLSKNQSSSGLNRNQSGIVLSRNQRSIVLSRNQRSIVLS